MRHEPIALMNQNDDRISARLPPAGQKGRHAAAADDFLRFDLAIRAAHVVCSAYAVIRATA